LDATEELKLLERVQEGEVLFHSREAPFPKELLDEDRGSKRLLELIHSFDRKLGELNIIFCSDRALQEIHEKELDEEDLTDIITFDHVTGELISGDLFISTERVAENARTHQRPAEEELHRVMAHGVLHLLGYKDKSKTDAEQMREAENETLRNWGF
jgi:probable rRNA maturation factor